MNDVKTIGSRQETRRRMSMLEELQTNFRCLVFEDFHLKEVHSCNLMNCTAAAPAVAYVAVLICAECPLGMDRNSKRCL